MVNLDKIKDLAKEKGWSMSFICNKMGVGASYFTDVKNGNVRVSQERLKQIAVILDTTTDYLTDKTEDKQRPDYKDEIPEVYLNLAKNARDRKIDPRDLEVFMETLERMRDKSDDGEK